VEGPFVEDNVNVMLQSYSKLLTKIHTSVKSLGTRLEDVEKNKSKRYKHMKKKVFLAEQKFNALQVHCQGLEQELEVSRQTNEQLEHRLQLAEQEIYSLRLGLNMRDNNQANSSSSYDQLDNQSVNYHHHQHPNRYNIEDWNERSNENLHEMSQFLNY
jgi:chromosome segregation ATPase